MRDVNQRDEDEFDTRAAATSHVSRIMTPRAPRTPSARRASFTALTSGTTTATAAQGSFVTSFSMPRDEQEVYLELAKSHLPQLVAECERNDNSSDDTASGGAMWKRIKSTKKKSDVHVWEKGCDASTANSSSTSSRVKASGAMTNHASGSVERDNNFEGLSALSALPAAVQTYAVRSVVRVPAPLDVVLKTLDCSAVTTYRSFTKIIYESLVADTSVLFHSQTSAPPTEFANTSAAASPCSASESLAVRWLVCRCNNPMVSDCDLCVLEYSKVTSVDDVSPHHDGKPLFTIRARNNSSRSNNSDSDGTGMPHSGNSRSREGLHDRREFPSAYKILCSIETKSCPELLDSHRLTRCVVPLGGFLFYPTDNIDITDVVFYMSIAQSNGTSGSSGNPFSSASSSERQFRATQRVMQHMARGIGRIKNAVDAYTMSLRLEMLRNTRWVRNTERAECVVCYRRFHQLTRRRHHCRLCGDVICRDCSVYKDADLPMIGPTVLRICKLCDLNELKGSAGSAAAAASCAAAATSNNAAQDEAPGTVPAFAKPLTRKRSTTLSVDTTKAAVHMEQQEPEIGRRFTTVVDGKDRRELSKQAFSCSKADIANRAYKWNTGGGGKPLVILSPTSTALYATRTGGGKAVSGAVARGFAKAMTPTGKRSAVAPQDWRAAVHPSEFALPAAGAVPPPSSTPPQHSNQFQAKSCSKMPSSHDRFVSFGKFASQGKGSALRDPAALNQDSACENIGEREEKRFAGDASAIRQQHAARVVKSGKLVVPSQEREDAAPQERIIRTAKRPQAEKNEKASNQQKEAHAELAVRKLQRIDEYEDILLALCEQVSMALDCKYAALSFFTSSSQHTTTTAGGAKVSNGSLPPSPTPPGPLETVHFLKAAGGKKLGKVAASLMCCTPVLELKEKLITRDALGNCNMFDFKRLPIVIGPQQVRFYAGVPLVDSCGQMVGALAVFDSSVYQGNSLSDVLPTMEAFASVAMSAIEDRKADLDLKSFLQHPLVDTSHDNQAARLSEPVFHIDLDLHGGAGLNSDGEFDGDDIDYEYPAVHSDQLQIHQNFRSRPMPPVAAEVTRGVEYYKSQMEQLVRQARETEAQMLETSMAMKRQGVAI